MPSLLLTHPSEWPEKFSSIGCPSFYGKSAAQWVFRKGIADWKEMTNIPLELRQELQEHSPLCSGKVVTESKCADGTTKILIKFPDGATTEAVSMPGGKGRTLCLSTQVGCPVRCTFCASGLDGLDRNLTRAEILEQVLFLWKTYGDFQRIVFMGLGDCGFNLEEVLAAVDILLDPEGANIAARRITLSTVGPRGTFSKLARWGRPVNIALSLHAPDDALRRQLVPGVAKRTIQETLAEAKALFEKTGREWTVEYVLLEGVNDSTKQAQELARLLRAERCHINLIPYNPVQELSWSRPSDSVCQQFAQTLKAFGLSVTTRLSRGVSKDAACGQLRRRSV